ncbi:MAG: HAD family hydrolase [Thiohalocapsa sp.]|jgi:putative hydrolase of the HAD superfamily
MRLDPPLRLLTIDLDDTVWPCAPVIREAEQALYAWLAAQTPRLTEAHDAASLREHRRALMQMRPDIAHDVTAVRLLAMRALMTEFGYPAALADEAMALFRSRRNQVQPYAEVAAALARLRRRYRLVAVTNGNAEVDETPLRGCFHRSLTAADAGAAKPDPALFRLAMDWAGVDAGQTLHVGDDPLRDVEAARRLGLHAVWVNRRGACWPAELAPPEHEVVDFGQLADWLDPRQRDGTGYAL